MSHAVEFKNVSKKYKMYDKQTDKLKGVFSDKQGQDFYALKDVSFTAEHGEVIGIIGVNGAGKSTMSSLLSGVTQPTSGEVILNGKASLIAIASGLDSKLTGLENIEMKLLMLGFSKKKIKELTKEIIQFSELEDFINQQVKSYSSGMKSRLGFAISINIDPDILIIDEALSVGDQTFTKKCLNKMDEFKEKGKTIFFISHSLKQVKNWCQKVIWMEAGQIREYGPVKELIPRYRMFIREFNKLKQDERKNFRQYLFERRQHVIDSTVIPNVSDILWNPHSKEFDKITEKNKKGKVNKKKGQKVKKDKLAKPKKADEKQSQKSETVDANQAPKKKIDPKKVNNQKEPVSKSEKASTVVNRTKKQQQQKEIPKPEKKEQPKISATGHEQALDSKASSRQDLKIDQESNARLDDGEKAAQQIDKPIAKPVQSQPKQLQNVTENPPVLLSSDSNQYHDQGESQALTRQHIANGKNRNKKSRSTPSKSRVYVNGKSKKRKRSIIILVLVLLLGAEAVGIYKLNHNDSGNTVNNQLSHESQHHTNVSNNQLKTKDQDKGKPENLYAINVGKANIRSGPSARATSPGYTKFADVFRVDQTKRDETSGVVWRHVYNNNLDEDGGWISDKLLTKLDKGLADQKVVSEIAQLTNQQMDLSDAITMIGKQQEEATKLKGIDYSYKNSIVNGFTIDINQSSRTQLIESLGDPQLKREYLFVYHGEKYNYTFTIRGDNSIGALTVRNWRSMVTKK